MLTYLRNIIKVSNKFFVLLNILCVCENQMLAKYFQVDLVAPKPVSSSLEFEIPMEEDAK